MSTNAILAFYQVISENEKQLLPQATQMLEWLYNALRGYQSLARRMDNSDQLSWVEPVEDIRNQLEHLFAPGFLQKAGAKWLKRYPVYIAAIERRLDAVDKSPEQDRLKRAELLPLWERVVDILSTDACEAPGEEETVRCRWLMEELRISMFAQSLGTAEKVSLQRIDALLSKL